MRTALRILSALALVLASHAAWAGNTGKISGRVTDAKTREPLVGVNVLIAGTKQGAATDVRGEFFVANVPAGTYTLRMTQVGYKVVQMTGVEVKSIKNGVKVIQKVNVVQGALTGVKAGTAGADANIEVEQEIGGVGKDAVVIGGSFDEL